mgnify:CR=1 FL=1
MHHDLDWARRLYLSELPFPKTYRVGKYTAIGPGKTRRQTLFTLEGCGVLKRFWTTAHRIELLNLAFFVDDSGTPVLSGKACEIARAAERLSCPAIPLGGFLDGRSVSLYLPFGRDWWPYAVRRVGESPRNAWLVMKALVSRQ